MFFFFNSAFLLLNTVFWYICASRVRNMHVCDSLRALAFKLCTAPPMEASQFFLPHLIMSITIIEFWSAHWLQRPEGGDGCVCLGASSRTSLLLLSLFLSDCCSGLCDVADILLSLYFFFNYRTDLHGQKLNSQFIVQPLLNLPLLPLIKGLWLWACTVHAVVVLRATPYSHPLFKAVPRVIDLLRPQSMKELDCVDQLSASTLQKPQPSIMFSFIQKVHVYFYTEALRSILDLSAS